MQITKILCILLFLTILLGLLIGCGTNNFSEETGQQQNTTQNVVDSLSVDLTSGPATILPRLEKAYNDQDIYAIVECFDPDITQAFFGVAKLFGVEADAFKSILPFMSKVIGASGTLDNSMWGTATLTALNYEVDNAIGTLTYNVNIVLSDGTTQSFDETIEVMLVDNVWYISSSQPVNITSLIGTVEIKPEPIPVTENITEADVKDGLFSISIAEDSYGTNYSYGFVNQSGKVIIEPFFADIGEFAEKYCPVRYKTDGFSKWGIIDRFGNLVIEYIFEEISAKAVDGFYAVKSGGKWGFLNVDTGEATGLQYDECIQSKEGYWAVCINEKWGFYNPTIGAEIPCIYEDYGEFSQNAIPVRLNGYWGAVDKDNNTVINFIYNEMSNGAFEKLPHFTNGIIAVKVNDAVGVIDKSGKYIIKLKKGINIEQMTSNFIVIYNNSGEENRKQEIYNTNGDLLISCDDCCGIVEDAAFVRSISENSTGQNSVNAVVIKSSGETVLDFAKNVYPQMKHDENDRIIFSMLYGGTYFSQYRLIGYYPENSQISAVYNLVDGNGKLLLPTWIQCSSPDIHIYKTSKYVSIYSSDKDKTSIFDMDGALIAELEGRYDLWSNDIAAKAGLYYMNWTQKESKKATAFYDITTKQIISYDSVIGNTENDAIIVCDGIFYGLYYKGELLGDGMNYTQITYDDVLKCFHMELGAVTKQIRIGEDETINYIEQTE